MMMVVVVVVVVMMMMMVVMVMMMVRSEVIGVGGDRGLGERQEPICSLTLLVR
jgi:hypothetical protein